MVMGRYLLSASEVLTRVKQGERFVPVDGTWYLNRPDLNPGDMFTARKIPGAVRFDLDEVSDKATSLPHMLPPVKDFNAFVQRNKLHRDLDKVLVYTQRDSFAAPRVWWTFRVFGFNAFVLDGGLEAYVNAGGSLDALPEPVHHDQVPEVRLDPRLVRNLQQMRDLSVKAQQGAALVVDARPAGRFTGKDPEPRPGLARGHIPGSVNLPFMELLTSGDLTKFKSLDEISEILKRRDIDVSTPGVLATSCGSGVTACVVTLALAELGRDLAQTPVYDGSWAEWGARDDTPKESNLV